MKFTLQLTRQMTGKLTLAVITLAAAISTQSASAQSIVSYTDSIDATITSWTSPLTLTKFDSSLGTLTSVKFSYGGNVQSEFEVESLDADAGIVTLNASAKLTFSLPTSTEEITVTNSASRAVSAYDGVIDFAGTSGFGPVRVIGTDSNSVTLTSGFSNYIGSGTYDTTVAAKGLSSVFGPGNVTSSFDTLAGALMTVEYTYTPVPEPSSLALMGLSLAGFGLFRRR